ncbi:MAG: hypothetical protein ACE5HO_00965 [bacterium]
MNIAKMLQQKRESACLRLSVLVMTVFLIGAITHALAQESFVRREPFQGQKIFKAKRCQRCHAIRGKGGNVARDLGWHEYYGTAFDLAADLWNHSPIMGEVMEELSIDRPLFSEKEMLELMSFLYYQRYLDKTGNVLKGKMLLSEKGCLKCHSVRGQGGKIAPRLDKLSVFVSPLFMVQAMWNHGPEMQKNMKRLNIRWPKFKGEEIVDLTNYLRILRMESSKDTVYLGPGNWASGKELFKTKGCLHCHAVGGEGGDIGTDVTQMDLDKSVTEIAGLMWNHSSSMMSIMERENIGWPKFQGNEMRDLISYLYFVKFTAGSGDVNEGVKIFKSKGCIHCHARSQGREPVGPELSELEPLHSPIQMAQIMWNHAPGMERKMQELDIAWPQVKKGEMQDLYEVLKHPTKLVERRD